MKTMKKKKQKNHQTCNIKKVVLFGILIFLGAIGLLFLELSANLQPMRDSIFYTLIFKLIYSAILTYFTWIHSSKPPLLGKILSSVIISISWMSFIISSSQILLIVKTLTLLSLIGYMIYIFIVNQKSYGVLTAQLFLFGVGSLLSIRDYSFINSPNGIHFWKVSLIIGMAVAVIAVFLLLKEKIILKDNRFSERLFFPLVVFIFIFAVMWSTACNMNYAFDLKEPTAYEAIIQDKKISTSYRSPTKYILELSINETNIDLNISQSEYYKYNIGDSFSIKLYKGAFNDPYYISGNQK